MDKYFALKKDVILVHGAKRGLIQDLNTKKIYSIDASSKKYLSMLLKGINIYSVLNTMDLEYRDNFSNYLNLLVKNNLGYYCKQSISSGLLENSLKDIEKPFNKISTVWLELRKACNLNCCHCYLDSCSTSDKDLNLLTLSEWKQLINELQEFIPKRIIFIGGEPLLFSKIVDLINYTSQVCSSSELILYSNLTLMNDEIMNCIKKNNVKVVTSIYSNTAEIHDKITNTPGSFNRTVNSIKQLRDLGLYIKANIALMKYNFTIINDIKNFTYKLTNNKSKIDIIRDVGTSKEYLIPKGNISLKKLKTSPDFKGINKKQLLRNFSGNSCWLGKLNITCDGYISPCIMSNSLLNVDFNVRTHNLASIINEYMIPSFWSISKDYIQECKDCEYRYVCSDCRVLCTKDNNKFLKDANCKYNPYLGIWNNSDCNI